jgi:hypothetical protein
MKPYSIEVSNDSATKRLIKKRYPKVSFARACQKAAEEAGAPVGKVAIETEDGKIKVRFGGWTVTLSNNDDVTTLGDVVRWW